VSSVSLIHRSSPSLLYTTAAAGSKEPTTNYLEEKYVLSTSPSSLTSVIIREGEEEGEGEEEEEGEEEGKGDEWLENDKRVDEEDDPYRGMLSLDKPLKPTQAAASLSEWTINRKLQSGRKQSATLAMIAKYKSASMAAKKALREKMVFWDDFLENELGDLDAELQEKDQWIYEMRDYVEKQKGFPIWSKRSEQEIAREMRKSQAERGLNVPANVAKVIRAVYLERSQTMKQFKAQDELAYMEFRKWMSETKRKTKKDPLPLAKTSVSKKWLLQPPSRFVSLAQLANPSTSSKSFFSSSSSSLADVPVLLDENSKNSEGVPRGNSLSTTTQSMRDWMKTREELDKGFSSSNSSFSSSSSSSPSSSSSSSSSPAINKVKQMVFEIDGTEMYVANSLVDISIVNSETPTKENGNVSEDENPNYFVVL